MPLESALAKTSKPRRLKDMAAHFEEEQKSGHEWKWEDEITKKDIVDINNIIIRLREKFEGATRASRCAAAAEFSRILLNLHLLGMDTHSFIIHSDADTIAKIYKELGGLIDAKMAVAACATIAFPHMQLVNKEDWRSFKASFNNGVQQKLLNRFAKQSIYVRLIKPKEKIGNLLYEESRFILENEITKDSQGERLTVIMGMKILDPDSNMRLTSDELEKFHKDMRRFIDEKADLNSKERKISCGILDIISKLRILTAYKVEVTDRGVKITDDPPEKIKEVPQRPIRKRFFNK